MRPLPPNPAPSVASRLAPLLAPVLATLLAVILALPAAAQEGDTVALGAATFRDACAGCHGERGEGDGPMTEILTVPVPDLTRIAARAGGDFPWLRVLHVIDGRTGLRAHGGPMPVFGALFRGDTGVADAPDGSPVIASERVLALVDYLESLQVKE